MQNNIMGWLDKCCEICGMKVDKKTAPQRFGKYFCSEKHAEEYANGVKKQRGDASKGQRQGGCC
jgi:hypothetical protein